MRRIVRNKEILTNIPKEELKTIFLKRAESSNDYIWKNLGVTTKFLKLRRMLGFLISIPLTLFIFLLLVMSEIILKKASSSDWNFLKVYSVKYSLFVFIKILEIAIKALFDYLSNKQFKTTYSDKLFQLILYIFIYQTMINTLIPIFIYLYWFNDYKLAKD